MVDIVDLLRDRRFDSDTLLMFQAASEIECLRAQLAPPEPLNSTPLPSSDPTPNMGHEVKAFRDALQRAAAPPEPLPQDVKALIQEARAAYAAVALYPEREPDGLNKLLALRNMIPRLVAALAYRQRAVTQAVRAEREAIMTELDELSPYVPGNPLPPIQDYRTFDAAVVECMNVIRARGAAQEQR